MEKFKNTWNLKEKSENEMCIGTFEKLRHIPRALEAHNSSNKRKTTLEDLEIFKPIQT